MLVIWKQQGSFMLVIWKQFSNNPMFFVHRPSYNNNYFLVQRTGFVKSRPRRRRKSCRRFLFTVWSYYYRLVQSNPQSKGLWRDYPSNAHRHCATDEDICRGMLWVVVALPWKRGRPGPARQSVPERLSRLVTHRLGASIDGAFHAVGPPDGRLSHACKLAASARYNVRSVICAN